MSNTHRLPLWPPFLASPLALFVNLGGAKGTGLGVGVFGNSRWGPGSLSPHREKNKQIRSSVALPLYPTPPSCPTAAGYHQVLTKVEVMNKI